VGELIGSTTEASCGVLEVGQCVDDAFVEGGGFVAEEAEAVGHPVDHPRPA
jgi:hypothetical protein